MQGGLRRLGRAEEARLLEEARQREAAAAGSDPVPVKRHLEFSRAGGPSNRTTWSSRGCVTLCAPPFATRRLARQERLERCWFDWPYHNRTKRYRIGEIVDETYNQRWGIAGNLQGNAV